MSDIADNDSSRSAEEDYCADNSPEPLTVLNTYILGQEAILNGTYSRDINWAFIQHDIGVKLLERYQWTGEDHDMTQAIEHMKLAIESTTCGSRRARYLHSLSGALQERYVHSPTTEDLELMIKALENSIQLTPSEERLNKANRLRDLGLAFSEKFFRSSHSGYIDSAIKAYRQVLMLTQDGDDDCAQAVGLSDLGLAIKYKLESKLEDIESAPDNFEISRDIDTMADCFQKAVRLSPKDNPNQALYQSNLGYVTLWRHKRNPSSILDINEAVAIFEDAASRFSESDPNGGTVLSGYVDALEVRYEKTNSAVDLDNAIGILGEVVRLAVGEFPAEALRLNQLGNLLHVRFDLKSNVDDLNASIKARLRAVELVPADYDGHEVAMGDLGKGLITRFELLGQEDDLNMAIETFQNAVESMPKSGRLYGLMLNELGCALRMHFERTGILDSLSAAMKWTQTLLDVEFDVEHRAITLSNLGACHQTLFETDGTLATLKQALGCQQAAVDLTPHRAPARPVLIAGLAESFRKLYDMLDSIEDLHEAIKLGEEATTTPGIDQVSPDKYSVMLTNLAVAFMRRYERLGNVNDVENSVKCFKKAEKHACINPLLQPLWSCNYSYCLLLRYSNTGTASVIHEAVATAKVAVRTAQGQDRLLPVAVNNLCQSSIQQLHLTGKTEASPEELLNMSNNTIKSIPQAHINRPMALNCRGVILTEIFHLTGSSKHLDPLVESFEEAFTVSKLHNKGVQAICLKDLAESLLTRFEWTRNVSDLDRGFDAAGQSVEILPESHPKTAVHLNTYGRAFLQRGIHASSVQDINSAIQIFERAGREFPVQHPQRSSCMNNLATALGTRFAILGTTDDLNAAIQAAMGATKSLSMGGKDKAVCLSNLGQILAQRFSRTGQDDDIDVAVESHSIAIDITATDNWRYVELLTNLAAVCMLRYQKHSRAEDLNEAVQRARQALDLAPRDSPERPRYLTNLSGALLEVVKSGISNRSVDDILDEAIQSSKVAAELSLEDADQYRPEILFNHAMCQESLFNRTKIQDDGLSAVKTYLEILDSTGFPVTKRVAAAIRAAQILYPGNVAMASRTLSQAVELLPKIISRSLLRNDQQFILSQIPGLAADAAALALQVDKGASEALRLLELGRGLISNLYISGHVDITDLEVNDRKLATRFQTVTDKISRLEEDVLLPGVKSFLQSQAARRYEVVQEFDQIVETIRGIPGYERFLRGPSSDQMKAYAADGPIVYINPSRFGAVALIITKKDIQQLPLEKLAYEELGAKAQQLTDIRDKDDAIHRRHNNASLRRILEWLWDVAVEEILEFLGFTGTPNSQDSWPRIWWIPVGTLSLFPIHAAGQRANGAAVMDRVVSCYATSARSLEYSREKLSTLPEERSQEVCLVSMSETPKRTDLTHAKDEIKTINELLSLPKVSLSQPTKNQVVEALRHSSIVHFACHGEMDSNPSYSRILFTDWEKDAFLVQDMANAAVCHEAQLAYLSACHAGTSKDMLLLDEAVHMTGGCQLAGFPAVVGTLWKVMDEYASVFAETIYRAMLEGEVLDVRKAAQGLHFAMRKVKLLAESPRGKDNPMAWAPYVYVGV